MATRTTTDDGGPGFARVVAQKWCPRCRSWKAVRHFHRDRHRPDGLYSICKSCRRPVQAASSARFRAAKGDAIRRYRAEHGELLRAKDRARHRENPEIAREKAREYRARNREKVGAQKRAAYAANADYYRAKARECRAKARECRARKKVETAGLVRR